MKKIEKGEFGYLPQQKKISLIKTLLMYAIALVIFLIGYYMTNTKANIMSILAVLVLLPASKSTVATIMFYRVPTYQEATYQRLKSYENNNKAIYQLFLTSYQKNFPISCFAANANTLIGYTEFSNCDVSACENHIMEILKLNGLKNITVKIFTDEKKYKERMEHWNEQSAESNSEACLSLMKDISL